MKVEAGTLSADRINMEIAYPTDLKEIRFGPTGKVVRITLRNGSSLPASDEDLAAKPLRNVDVIRIYSLPVHYFLLLQNERHRYAWHMPSCTLTGTDVDRSVSGESVIEFADNGTISKVVYPDDQIQTAPTDDLMAEEIVNVDVLAFRTYTLMELRDRESEEIFYRVL